MQEDQTVHCAGCGGAYRKCDIDWLPISLMQVGAEDWTSMLIPFCNYCRERTVDALIDWHRR